MRKPPILTEEERAAALTKARNSRAHRAKIKAEVRAGELSVEQVIDRANTDEGAIEAAEEYVYDERNISAGYFDMSSEVILDPVEIERNYRHADERNGPKP